MLRNEGYRLQARETSEGKEQAGWEEARDEVSYVSELSRQTGGARDPEPREGREEGGPVPEAAQRPDGQDPRSDTQRP